MGFIIATLIVLVAIAAALAQDFAIFSWAYWQEGGTSTSRSEVFRNVGLFFVAMIALGFGIWRAWTAHRQAEASQRQAEAASEQARIAQQGQITERFSRATEHLGSGELPVRLGGIYALWRLAQDSPERDVVPVIDILCAFVRDPPPIEPPPSTGEADAAQTRREPSDATAKLRPDVQAVLKLIGNEKADYRAFLPAGYRLDLSGANLTGAQLRGINLSGADLLNANLMDASLMDVNLTNTSLWNANLMEADFTRADLTHAKNLTQEQVDGIRYNPEHPPKLPPGLVLPEPPPEPEAKMAAPPPEA